MVKISVSHFPEGHQNGQKTSNDTQVLELDAKMFVFDKDGTLLTHDHFIPIVEKRIELLSSKLKLSNDNIESLSCIMGLDPKSKQIIPRGTMFIARKDTQILTEAFLVNLGINRKIVFNKVGEVFEKADKIVNLEDFIHTFPEVPGFLENLKENNVKIAIATHDSTITAINQLKLVEIDNYIDLIIGLDYNESILHKPSPSMLITACNEFELEPGSAVVVGDSVNDVLMGINGGAGLSVGVLTGEHKLEDFKKFNALINSMEDFKFEN